MIRFTRAMRSEYTNQNDAAFNSSETGLPWTCLAFPYLSNAAKFPRSRRITAGVDVPVLHAA